MASILEWALEDAKALEAGGANALMIENFFDTPFPKAGSPPHTIAALARVVSAVREKTTLPLGVNVLRNDALSALALAHLCGAQFVRINVYVGAAVTDQGIIEGAAREAFLYRKHLGADVAIWADIGVKHARQIGSESLTEAAKDAVQRGLADALIVSGVATGGPTRSEDAREIKDATPQTPLLVGSGFDVQNASDLLPFADGAIVGSSLKHKGEVSNPVDVERVRVLRHAMQISERGKGVRR
jgi:membrane complex biogenesis BtpA family protein